MLWTSSLCLFSINLESRTLAPNFHCLSSKCFTFLSWPFHSLSSAYSTETKPKSMTFPPPVPYSFISLFLHTGLNFPLSETSGQETQTKKPCLSPWAFIYPPGHQLLLSQAQPIHRSRDSLSVPPHHSTSASTTASVS